LTDAIPTHWKVRALRRHIQSCEDAVWFQERHGDFKSQEAAGALLRTFRSILADYEAQKIEDGLQGRRRAANG
tara:strand:- start:14771 stop:14989 length:219 start_codon:yes stop_codon:yes gene_type:complete